MHHPVVTIAQPAAGRVGRPSRAQIEPAALALLARHSAGLLATARRYSACPEDAEDAYQRGVEILLTKAPSTREDELLPWLRTVVKHEAFAVRKSAGRAQPTHAAGVEQPDAVGWTDERAERYERLRIGAEAMAGLKPDEIRGLLLRAEGLSYNEICTATGWSYTKVNRCITEGRRAFLKRVASIEAGVECERLAPLISRAADGEASAAQLRRLRPHLKGCLACKATLREYRAAPARLAGLVPPVVALAAPGHGSTAQGFVLRALQALQNRFAGPAELAGVKKAAVVAASAALLAGGGAAGVQAIHHDAPVVPGSAFEREAARMPAGFHPLGLEPSSASTSASDPAPFVPPPTAMPAETVPSAQPSAPVAEFDPGTAAMKGMEPGAGTARPARGAAPTTAARAPERSSATPAAREFGP